MTHDELLTFVEEVEQEGAIDEVESELLRSAIEFSDREASDILTPRTSLYAVDGTLSNDEISALFAESGYSRLPVYSGSIDSIVGIAMLIFYVLCAVIRLAFFNVLESKRQKTESGCAKSYRGLPVTSASIILPFFFILGLILPDKVMMVIYYILPVLVGLAFITDFRCPKFDVSKLLSRRATEPVEEEIKEETPVA